MKSALSLVHEDGFAIVTVDLPGEPVNKVTAALRAEFGELFGQIERDSSVRGVILMSAKPDTWIAGADIDEFLAMTGSSDAEALSRGAQALLERLYLLRVPVVAAIHGACLGGGLEAALACHYRIATDHPKTVLALPEVQLGLIPGAGGTQRLPRLIGLQRALDMILTGRNIRAKKAYQMGLVDEIVHPAILRDVALDRARKLADGSLEPRRSPKGRGATGLLLEDNPLGRSIVFRKAREGVMSRTHGHYPAPLAALEAVKAGYDGGAELGYRMESRAFGELAPNDVTRELIFLFFATNALKKDPGIHGTAPEPQPIATLGVLGAGFMGAGIASIAVQQGTPVRLKDTDLARVGKGIAGVSEVLRERLKKKQITRLQYEDQLLLAGGTVEYTGFGRANLVIEAVFEDLALKQRVLREVEPLLHDDAIYASNTSTIPISQIAEAAARPNRVLGMHFFSPVHKMPLLEVIATGETDDDAIVTAVAYGKQLGKTVIVVNDAPGFYTTRILSAYMNEAGRLLDEGASIGALDAALTAFGFPVGPLTLLDEVGIDVGGKVGQVLHEAFGARMAPSDSLRRVVASGRTGRKGRKGFYLYDEQGKKGDVDPSVYEVLPGGVQRVEMPAQDMQTRCVLAMVNEAALCFDEGVLRSTVDGDVGAVFGIGFPPFRGGPFRYVDAQGAARVVDDLELLNERFPGRFAPAEVLQRNARRQERFYPTRGDPFA
ncbi:MAG: fatty acid oxidation complex subunit alpha FadJ [Gemmatimonadetes bacterium]|jgi:3-hydroxyacyl-CoA dehydrogenase/enoyl-CoA hydratase/3-hydroxybutyryl-CoA epimerase|nr:fatty acid oxidation complex subunit alpha FadJ [Gemmatimonadota bacterium]